MNLKLVYLLILISFFKLNAQEFTVVLDPGHGGHDSGAVGYNDIYEKNINLQVALEVKRILKDYDNITVILTRDKDIFLDLELRADIAKLFNPNLFVSLHCNGSRNIEAQGVSIYLQDPNSTKDKSKAANYRKALRFGFILDDIFKTHLKMKSQGILFKNLSVLRNTIDIIPSVLVEMGFISNKTESDYFNTKGKYAIANAIAKSIIDYSK